MALAYYPYRRIAKHFTMFSEQIMWTNQGSLDRQQGLHYLKSSTLPNGVLDIAYQSDQTGRT